MDVQCHCIGCTYWVLDAHVGCMHSNACAGLSWMHVLGAYVGQTLNMCWIRVLDAVIGQVACMHMLDTSVVCMRWTRVLGSVLDAHVECMLGAHCSHTTAPQQLCVHCDCPTERPGWPQDQTSCSWALTSTAIPSLQPTARVRALDQDRDRMDHSDGCCYSGCPGPFHAC